MRHSNSLHDMPSTSWDMSTISKMGPTIAEGPAMLRVPRGNSLVGKELPKETSARDEATQRVDNIWCI
jgi:hypothetical protein